MLHDLFSDWLASEAVRHGLGELPEMLGESLEEATVFLAEVGALDRDRLWLVIGNPVAATRAADAQPESDVDVQLANECGCGCANTSASTCERRSNGCWLRVLDVDPRLVLLADEEADDDTAVADVPVVLASRSPRVIPQCGGGLVAGGVATGIDWRTAVTSPPRQPDSTADLAALIEEVVSVRAAEVDRLVDEVVPILGDRVRREIGPAGIPRVAAAIRASSCPTGRCRDR